MGRAFIGPCRGSRNLEGVSHRLLIGEERLATISNCYSLLYNSFGIDRSHLWEKNQSYLLILLYDFDQKVEPA